jgi:hypothetical protein
MDAMSIRQALTAQPFQSFTLHLADGRSIDVPHSEFASVSHSGRRVIVEKTDDSWQVVDTLLINRIEIKPQKSAA